MTDKVWSSMIDVSEKLLLDKAKPNQSLVEEALSFNAAELHMVSDIQLRQYLVVLGQYLITLQYEENKADAVCTAWQRALESHLFRVMSSPEHSAAMSKRSTLAERRAYAVETDEQTKQLDLEYQLADSKRCFVKNMNKPIEQYMNTLKKEVDARENEKSRLSGRFND